jgi:hypothetical protein
MRLIVLFAAVSGCSFFVEPVVVTGGDDGGSDLAAQPEDDLSVPEDLAQPDGALADLRANDQSADIGMSTDMVCTPSVFPGFGGAGGATSPFSCTTCGCIIDDFTSNTNPRWTRTSKPGWSDSIGGGLLTITGAQMDNGTEDLVSSQGHFYLQGDFVLSMDYSVTTWPSGGGLTLLVQSPQTDLGAAVNQAIAHTYTATAVNHHYMQIAAQAAQDTATAASSGTFEISRTGDQLCARYVGAIPGLTKCGTVAGLPASLSVAIQGSVFGSSCFAGCGAGCCAFQTQSSNLVLKSGTIVSLP